MKNRLYLPFLWTFCWGLLVAPAGYGQKIDSLKQLYQSEADDSTKAELLLSISSSYLNDYADSTDQGFDYAKEAYEFSKSKELILPQIRALAGMGKVWRNRVNKRKSIACLERAYALADSIGDQSWVAKIRGNKATALAFFGDLEEATAIKLEVIETFEALNDSTALQVEWYGIGYIYGQNNNPRKALPYYLKALNYDTTHPLVLATIGRNYSGLQQPDSAYHYLEKALAYSQEGSALHIDILNKLGNIHLENGDYEQGIALIGEALEGMGEDSQLDLTYKIKHNMIDAYRLNGQLTQAEELLKSIVEDSLVLLTRARHYEVAYRLFEAQGDYQRAFLAHQNYHAYSDSISNVELSSKVEDLQIKYETAEKEREIMALESTQRIKDTQLRNQRRLLLLTVLFLLLAAGLGYFIYRLYQKTKEQNVVIGHALSEKELLLKEIHHRVKNNLQVVSSLLSLQSQYVEDDKALSAINEGRNRVRSIALIHQDIYQHDTLTGIHVSDYFSKLISALFQTYNIQEDQVKLQLDIEDAVIDVETIVPLGLIANELVSNALKYAFQDTDEGVLAVSLHTEEGAGVLLEVKDNGPGFDHSLVDENVNSFGYQMILAFVRRLDAVLNFDTQRGTHVSVRIPEVALV